MPGIRDPYTFTFDQQETETLLQGLGKLPAERSYNLLTRMANEIAQENQRRQAPPAGPAQDQLAGTMTGPVGGLSGSMSADLGAAAAAQ